MTRKTTPTHVLLNQITLAASSSDITFSNIPQGYSDLIVRITHFQSGSLAYRAVMQLNGDTGNNYPLVYLDGGSSAASSSETNPWLSFGHQGASASSTLPMSHEMHLFDYSSTDKHTVAMLRGGNAPDKTSVYVMRWANNAAVTSLKIYPASGGSFLTNSTFSLYGVYA